MCCPRRSICKDPRPSKAMSGFRRIFEIDQSNLQQLLYELETGMPFLFIDQLVVQMPQSAEQIRRWNGNTPDARANRCVGAMAGEQMIRRCAYVIAGDGRFFP